MGAREAAGMAPVVKPDLPRVDFPTKFLPPALHQKYISENDVTHLKASYRLIDAAAADIGTKLLQRKGAEASQKAPPPLARQRQLRVGQPSKTGKIADVGDGAHTLSRPAAVPPPSSISFKDVAAEYFILPLINRFWNYFENELTREARAKGAFRAAGTGMILSPMAVAKLLSTLAIMVHASRHSTAFLAIIAPEALELAVMVGQNLKTNPDPPSEANGPREAETETDVLGSALELALVCLDASKELDGGRTLVIDKMDVLVAAGEWAGHLFEQEHEGVTTGANAGGLSEGRTRKAAAGVVVLVSEIVDQSRHLLGWTTS
jgi:telomere length regulation protein